MPRSDLVGFVRGIIGEEGSDRFIVLDHWSEISPAIVPDGRHVLFGQVLCHQVPAVVRLRNDASPGGDACLCLRHLYQR